MGTQTFCLPTLLKISTEEICVPFDFHYIDKNKMEINVNC